MFKIEKPEIDGKWNFREGMYIHITAEFKDASTVIGRLRLDDPREKFKFNYDEKWKPKYKFSKFYLNMDKNEIITERVFYIEETESWIGITDCRHGTLHLYLPRFKSAFPKLNRDPDDIGIFYRFDTGMIIAYSVNDSAAQEACINWIFNNQDKIKMYMEKLEKFDKEFHDEPYLGALRYHPNEDGKCALTFLEI